MGELGVRRRALDSCGNLAHLWYKYWDISMFPPELLTNGRKSVLCWLATADAQGQPNVSPKEIFTFYGAEYLLIANIASPRSVCNILANPRVCVSFIDVFVQKGFKVSGVAQNIVRQDAGYEKWAAPLNAMAGPRFPVRSVILIQVTACEPILAPSYQFTRTKPQSRRKLLQRCGPMAYSP